MQDAAERQTPRVLSFTQHDLPIDLPAGRAVPPARRQATREYILPELLGSAGATTQRREVERDASQASFNFRLVEVVMMLLLPLLAVALAIPPKRSTSALGVFVSIVMVVAYHKVNQYGQDVAALGRIDPMLALWGPFVLFAALIVLDVLAGRLCARRAGDRRARDVLRQDRPSGCGKLFARRARSRRDADGTGG